MAVRRDVAEWRERLIGGDLQARAEHIAKVVRDAMEDFHVEHLSDAQMAELNPIIRNGIYRALWLEDEAYRESDSLLTLGARGMIAFEFPPPYWEPPSLPAEYADVVRKIGRQIRDLRDSD